MKCSSNQWCFVGQRCSFHRIGQSSVAGFAHDLLLWNDQLLSRYLIMQARISKYHYTHIHTYIYIYIYIYMYIYMYTSVLHIYKHHVVMINFGEKICEILHEFLCLGPFWEQMLLDSHDFGIMDPRIVISSAMHHTKGEHLFDAWISHLRDSSA